MGQHPAPAWAVGMTLGTGRYSLSLLLTNSDAASPQPGGILVEKAHNSLLCQEGRTGQGHLAVLRGRGAGMLGPSGQSCQGPGSLGAPS